MTIEKFTMKLTVIDCQNDTSFERSYKGEAPSINEFANFCYEAGRAYGFTEELLNEIIHYHIEY